MREHKIITKGAATELETESLGSIIGGDWSSIQFQSAAPPRVVIFLFSVLIIINLAPLASRTLGFILVLPVSKTEHILLRLPH